MKLHGDSSQEPEVAKAGVKNPRLALLFLLRRHDLTGSIHLLDPRELLSCYIARLRISMALLSERNHSGNHKRI